MKATGFGENKSEQNTPKISTNFVLNEKKSVMLSEQDIEELLEVIYSNSPKETNRRVSASTTNYLYSIPCAKDWGFKFLFSRFCFIKSILKAMFPDIKGDMNLSKIDLSVFANPFTAKQMNDEPGQVATIYPDISYHVSFDDETKVGHRRDSAFIFNFEMQRSSRPTTGDKQRYNLEDRMIYYAARHLCTELTSKADYTKLNDVFSIWIMGENLYNDDTSIRQIMFRDFKANNIFECELHNTPNDDLLITHSNGREYKHLLHVIVIELPKLQVIYNKHRNDKFQGLKNLNKRVLMSVLYNLSIDENTKGVYDKLLSFFSDYKNNPDEYEPVDYDIALAYKEEEIMREEFVTKYVTTLDVAEDKLMVVEDKLNVAEEELTKEKELRQQLNKERDYYKLKSDVLSYYISGYTSEQIANRLSITTEEVESIISGNL